MTALVKPTLAEALVAAQKEMPAVEADAVNPHFKSRFVSLDHLIAKTRPVLNKHGLAIIQAPAHIDGQPALRTTLYHQSGESVTDVMPLILAGQDMQKLGAALTYARRYAWAAALGIAGEEDDDGNTASAPAAATAGAAKAAVEPPQVPAATPSTIRDPSGEPRSDAQAKLLFQLATKLTGSGALTEEALLGAAATLGVEGAKGIQSLSERVTKSQASTLIEKLRKLDANVKAQAAA